MSLFIRVTYNCVSVEARLRVWKAHAVPRCLTVPFSYPGDAFSSVRLLPSSDQASSVDSRWMTVGHHTEGSVPPHCAPRSLQLGPTLLPVVETPSSLSLLLLSAQTLSARWKTAVFKAPTVHRLRVRPTTGPGVTTVH